MFVLSSPPKLYTEFAKYYDRLEGQYRDYELESKWLGSLLESSHSKRIIDVSCGTARHLQEIVDDASVEEAKDYVAMDVSPQMISVARSRLNRKIVPNILLADFLNIPFKEDSFDSALCMYWSLAGLNHLQTGALFHEIARVLEPSGMLVFDVENAEGIKENLLNEPFFDAFFFDEETNSNVSRANLSKKIAPDIVDWHAYYLIEREGVSELVNDEMKLRFYSKSMLEALLKEAGFRIVSFSSSPGGTYQYGSPSLYCVAKKL